MCALQLPQDPNLLVGYETSDDAAVYRLSPDLAVISTVDFITPPVDDPYWFGQIAAANSLSDVYAMGGRPVTALNLVMYPSKKLDMSFLKDILRGGNDKVVEAGASLAGGHSVDDNEPKYGLSVTGVVHPSRILTNCNANVGDALVLTKPLGTGVLFNANRSGKLRYADLEKILPLIASLNRRALEAALKFPVHSCTDITGFGIAGHALEMAKGSGLQISLEYKKLPFYPDTLSMYKKGETTGSNKANRKLCEGHLKIAASLSREEEELLFDPQTSGGLLLALPAGQADDLVKALQAAGVVHAVKIGEVIRAEQAGVRVV
ncbi:MAG: selenide, water dikinase SelD [Nitrospirae bacterium GWC2_57_13]|jgi:selenide, water dikinase|nr:MAG: selenide, water dikinase SelD [Nitrospirae bacterium GWC2_57_13]OGW43791.1 MAG: selenide, water dikinase SelD [Nitrospirae bacterium GWD2_57_8]